MFPGVYVYIYPRGQVGDIADRVTCTKAALGGCKYGGLTRKYIIFILNFSVITSQIQTQVACLWQKRETPSRLFFDGTCPTTAVSYCRMMSSGGRACQQDRAFAKASQGVLLVKPESWVGNVTWDKAVELRL